MKPGQTIFQPKATIEDKAAAFDRITKALEDGIQADLFGNVPVDEKRSKLLDDFLLIITEFWGTHDP